MSPRQRTPDPTQRLRPVDSSRPGLDRHHRTDSDPLVGKTIGNYRLLEQLGKGGMGKVYLAEHTLLHTKVAVKLLSEDYAGNRDLEDRFVREARLAMQVEHPHVIRVRDVGKADNTLYLVMEYIEGNLLLDALQKGPMPWERTQAILLQICDALQAIHGQGIVHRDLKPHNIMLTEKDRDADFVKLFDFGIARPFTDAVLGTHMRLTVAGGTMGTPEYMSPEQARGEESLDHRSDIYALGIVMYELMTGKVPFKADSFQDLLAMHINALPRRPTERFPDLNIPPEVEAIIMCALEKDPAARFQSAREMAEGIRACRPKSAAAPAEAPPVVPRIVEAVSPSGSLPSISGNSGSGEVVAGRSRKLVRVFGAWFSGFRSRRSMEAEPDETAASSDDAMAESPPASEPRLLLVTPPGLPVDAPLDEETEDPVRQPVRWRRIGAIAAVATVLATSIVLLSHRPVRTYPQKAVAMHVQPKDKSKEKTEPKKDLVAKPDAGVETASPVTATAQDALHKQLEPQLMSNSPKFFAALTGKDATAQKAAVEVALANRKRFMEYVDSLFDIEDFDSAKATRKVEKLGNPEITKLFRVGLFTFDLRNADGDLDDEKVGMLKRHANDPDPIVRSMVQRALEADRLHDTTYEQLKAGLLNGRKSVEEVEKIELSGSPIAKGAAGFALASYFGQMADRYLSAHDYPQFYDLLTSTKIRAFLAASDASRSHQETFLQFAKWCFKNKPSDEFNKLVSYGSHWKSASSERDNVEILMMRARYETQLEENNSGMEGIPAEKMVEAQLNSDNRNDATAARQALDWYRKQHPKPEAPHVPSGNATEPGIKVERGAGDKKVYRINTEFKIEGKHGDPDGGTSK